MQAFYRRYHSIHHSTHHPILSHPTKSWSKTMNLTVPLYRLALHSCRNSVQRARQVLKLFRSTIPNDITLQYKDFHRSTHLLKGMNSQEANGALNAEILTPKDISNNSNVVLYLHGGAYVMCSAKGHRILTTCIARESNTKVMAINYRLAPEHPFPLALHDALSAYLHLLETHSPNQIVVMGDSAGGGLVFSLSLLLRDLKMAQPAGLVALAPWLDLTHSLPSFRLQAFDYLPLESRDPKWINLHRSQYYTTNDSLNSYYLVSPLFAKETQLLPPTLIHIGSHERLRDESIMFKCNTMSKSPIKLEIFKDQIHVFQVFSGEPSSVLSLKKAGQFIKNVFSESSYLSESGNNKSGIWEIDANTLSEHPISTIQAMNYIDQGKIILERMAQSKSSLNPQKQFAYPKNLSFYRV